ncbi:MAG: PAS domain S-box protein, partial [Deltaproteobacteria bacterium]
KWGKYAYLRLMFTPMRDLNGEVRGCQAAVEDITERKKAEEELVRLATAVDQVSDTVLMTDTDGKIVYVNPAFERTCGYTRGEVLGRSPHFLSSGHHDETFYRKMWNTIASGKVWSGRLINKKKDGTLFEEEAAITPIKDESGEIVNYVAVKRDVTNEVALEKQLRQAQKMEAIGTLAGGIAHDFNNLLTIVLGFTELLLIDQDENDPRHEDLQKIALTARHGGELVQRLLTFSRRAETKLRPLDLNDQVRQVKELLARTIPKMIKLELHLETNLKTIYGDPAQIEQLLLNLAVNAKDVMPQGGNLILETKNVWLDEAHCHRHLEVKPGEHVLLTVSDTGPGMEKEVVDRIFEPFYTTKLPGEGTGLGLAMVFGIVKSHGGHIDCHSEPGEGTIFKIYLPVARGDAELSPAISGEMPAFGTETILLVDDEELIRELGRRLLSRAGYEVVTAATGGEALELYRKHSTRISLVVLDLMMPDMGGTECLNELLKMDPDARILIASGYSPNGRTQEILEIGARGFVSKPFKAKQVLQMIRQILDKN